LPQPPTPTRLSSGVAASRSPTSATPPDQARRLEREVVRQHVERPPRRERRPPVAIDHRNRPTPLLLTDLGQSRPPSEWRLSIQRQRSEGATASLHRGGHASGRVACTVALGHHTAFCRTRTGCPWHPVRAYLKGRATPAVIARPSAVRRRTVSPSGPVAARWGSATRS
jgi:hypothetical protein